jgi:uncharacterized protein YuzE
MRACSSQQSPVKNEGMGEGADGLIIDLDSAGEVVGFDIDHASRRLDLTTLETVSLPVRSTRAA